MSPTLRERPMPILLVLAVAATIAAASPALAQPDAYLELSAAGVAASAAGRQEEAYALFEQAHAVFPNARSFRAMAATAFQLRRYALAIQHYEAALADERRPMTPEQRAQAEEELSVARRLVGTTRVVVETPGATATIDGDDIALAASLVLDPGPHELIVRASGYVEQRRSFTTRAGEEHPFDITLEPDARSAMVVAPPPVTPPARTTVRVHVEGRTDDTTLYRRTGTAGPDEYAPLCVAPCDLELEPGTYTLGLSAGQRHAQRADHDVFRFDHDTSIQIEYQSREAEQTVGVIAATLGVLGGGLTMLFAAVPPRAFEEDELTALVAGSVLTAVGLIISLPLVLLNDHADISETN
jgi:hypothetical protein